MVFAYDINFEAGDRLIYKKGQVKVYSVEYVFGLNALRLLNRHDGQMYCKDADEIRHRIKNGEIEHIKNADEDVVDKAPPEVDESDNKTGASNNA